MEAAPCRQQVSDGEDNLEIGYLKRQDSLHAQEPPLARQVVSSDDSTPTDELSNGEIEVGYLYEINHKYLPPKSPNQLKAIRAVKVSEKTRLDVSVRFPSIFSLRECFGLEHGKSPKAATGDYPAPALDEQFVMGTNIARKVLRRHIPSSEFEKEQNLESFWIISSEAAGNIIKKEAAPSSPKKKPFLGSCAATLKCAGLVRWGVRRKVRYIGRHREMPPISCVLRKKEVEDDDEKPVAAKKRPRVGPSSYDKKRKETRPDPKDRWSKERYMMAELKLTEIMEAKGAVLGNPILRPELRAEARKKIGDTGLLDHLLKHMAGKVVAQRDVRFRRRHNPEGAMEYWLEQANLLELRRQAGVQDPYWTPPPGWKPSDGPVMDAACAREMKKLKEEMALIKRALEELIAKKHEREDPQAEKHEKDASIGRPSATAAKEAVLDSDSTISLQETDRTLKRRKCMLEEQLKEISNSLDRTQEEMIKLAGEVEGVMKKKGEQEDKEWKQCKTVLRSGFRICKPQGTFLWPGSACCSSLSPRQLQAEDFLMVPTPPSASSATSAPPLPLAVVPKPSSPVKPQPKMLAKVALPQPDSCCEKKISERTGSSGAEPLSRDILLQNVSSGDGDNQLSAASWLALATPCHSISRF